MKRPITQHAFALTLLGMLALVLTTPPPLVAAVESPHGPLTFDCQLCHTTAGWRGLRAEMAFSHETQTGFALVGRHKNTTCISCHSSLKFGEAGTECLDCHTDIHRGQFSANCTACHTPEQWVDESSFRKFHETTRFPLVGVHSTVDCQSCHATGQYANLSTSCESCHANEFASTSTPNHAQAGFSRNCTDCHNIVTAGWKGPKFEHTQTFPLTGGHALENCQACHADGYANTVNACAECHIDNYTSAQNPTHETGAFPNTCETCHTTTAWRPATFTNHALTAFPLTGAHVQTDCAQCHTGGQYTGTSTVCADCHASDYAAAQNPTHEEGAFPNTCEQCHTTGGWRPATFDNHNLTAFPLTGAHIGTDCAQCHIGGQYTGTSLECWSCHETDYTGTTDPNHVTGNYSQNCAVCHSTENWTETSFNHDATDFPLTGAHIQTDCAQCHVNGQFTGTPADCWSCHEADYTGTTNPNHVTGGYPQDCAVCHGTDGWEGATFNHDNTAFPLSGAHVQTNCAQCHVGGIYQGTPTDCWLCHEPQFTQAEGHVQNSYPHTCEVCHSTSNWESNFNHSNTQFPLTGRHVETNCTECHIGGVFQGTPTDCWSCHEVDYNEADDHLSNNFPHDCALCHNTSDWDETTFNHNNTDFPLTGAHVQTSCTECHINGVYNGTPTDCWSCHEDDYNDAEDHLSNNYPHDCLQCHSTTSWESGFNHSNTDFPLTGAHTSVNCLDCHTGGQFENTPTDCWFCHQADFDGATPDHNDGYPQACVDCHTTTNWSSNFNHDGQYFPIYTGRHRDEWNLCNECHTTNGNFATFSCIDCHEHDNQNDVDDEHDEVNGYTYTPTSCYVCHPNGNGDDRGEPDAPRTVKPRRTEVQK